MKSEVGAFEAKTHLSRLLDQVQEGGVVYITRHGKPVARLMPPEPESTQKAEFGCAKGNPGEFYMAPDFDQPLEDFKAYSS
jgi:prevent-host-death family protein